MTLSGVPGWPCRQRKFAAAAVALALASVSLSPAGADSASAAEHRALESEVLGAEPALAGNPLLNVSFVGGTGPESGVVVVPDGSGGAFAVGFTTSTDFPVLPGALNASYAGQGDLFIVHFDAGGSKTYASYLGGSGHEVARSAALDPAGVLYVAGRTNSTDFPTTTGAIKATYGGGFDDGFVLGLNTSGSSLDFSTYLGGDGYDAVEAIALGPDGSPYLTGCTSSTDFSTTPGAFDAARHANDDAFVARLAANGSELTYSTFLGSEGPDCGLGIAVSPGGEAVVTGRVGAADFPVTPGALDEVFDASFVPQDAFVTRLASDGGSLVFSTYLGGDLPDTGMAVRLDGAGDVWVAGQTSAVNFPTTSGVAQESYAGGASDAFLVRLNSSGDVLVFSTFLGSALADWAGALALDGSGNATVAGGVYWYGFPTTPEIVSEQFSGGAPDAFVAVLNGAGAIYASTLLGGRGYDAVDSLAHDGADILLGGFTNSTDFPLGPDDSALAPSGGFDGFLVRLHKPGPIFSIELAPSIGYGLQGGEAAFNVTLRGYYGYQGAMAGVLFSSSHAGISGDCTPSPPSVPGTCTLAVSVSSGVPTGFYNITVTGDNGTAQRSATAGLWVSRPPPPPDFSIELAAATVQVDRGSNGTLEVSVNGNNGYLGPDVSITASGLPSGATAACAPMVVAPGNSCLLEMNVSLAVAAANYSFVVEGTNGSATRSANATLRVTDPPPPPGPPPEFTVSPESSWFQLIPGGDTSFTVSVAADADYAGASVVLGLTGPPAGISGSCQPAGVVPPGSCTFFLVVRSGVALGNYSLLLSGSNGSATRSVPLSLEVLQPPPPPDFGIEIDPVHASVMAGSLVWLTVWVNGTGSYAGPAVNVFLSGAPPGVSWDCKLTGVWPSETCSGPMLVNSSVASGNYTFLASASNGTTQRTAPFELSVLTPAPPPPEPDFSIEVAPALLVLRPGESTFAVLQVLAVAGAPAPAVISVTVTDQAGLMADCAPRSLPVAGNCTLTVEAPIDAPPGIYALSVTASAGNLSRTATLTVLVQTSGAPVNQEPDVLWLFAFAALAIVISVLLVWFRRGRGRF